MPFTISEYTTQSIQPFWELAFIGTYYKIVVDFAKDHEAPHSAKRWWTTWLVKVTGNEVDKGVAKTQTQILRENMAGMWSIHTFLPLYHRVECRWRGRKSHDGDESASTPGVHLSPQSKAYLCGMLFPSKVDARSYRVPLHAAQQRDR